MNFNQTDERGNFKLQLYHENYGYDLQAVLSKYPIKALDNDPAREDLLRSLKKGNLQQAVFLIDGKQTTYFIEANPHYKTIGIYDADFKKIDNRLLRDVKQIEVEYEQVGETKKKSLHTDSSQTVPKQAKNTRQRRSNKL